MVFFRILKHIGIVAAGVLLILGIPLCCTGYVSTVLSGDVDAVTSASQVLDEPSGDFVILINQELHPDEDALRDWVRFFRGDVAEGELVIIFEDIARSVPAGDAAGVEMAESLRSQLPENQMTIEKEDGTLIVSRADAGLFDMIIMSREFADSCHLETAYTDRVQVVEMSGD